MSKYLKASAKTNYLASMLSFAAVALSSITDKVTTFDQNVALAFGLMTGISAVISIQLLQGERQ